MSKLDELIAELCPDGVEYIPLGEVLKNNNSPNSISKKYYKENGDIPIIDQSQVYIAGYTDDESAVPPILPCIIFGDHTRVVKYADRKFAQGDSGTKVFIPVTEDLNTKYIYYAFCNIDIPSRGYNRHWTIAKNIKIPLPPLPVQQEIVRILDNFTELTAELTTELTARRKQYEYYIDRVINANNYQHIPLNDVAKVYDGTHQTPNYTESGVKFVSVENINDLYGTTKRISEVDFSKYKIKPQPGDVFMTRIGDVGTPAVVTTNEPIAYYVSLALIRPNKELLPQYLYFYIKSSAFRKELYKRTLHTAVPIKINKEDIGKCRVAVPPIKEQQRVIALLSRFDTLCNDISSGLPAEIETRQKQYEYYRDKLLSFKEVTA